MNNYYSRSLSGTLTPETEVAERVGGNGLFLLAKVNEPSRGEMVNCGLVERDDHMIVRTKRAIRAGEELLMDYGDE